MSKMKPVETRLTYEKNEANASPMIKILFVILLLQSLPTMAANWIFVGATAGSAARQDYIDTDSIFRQGSILEAWTLSNFEEPRPSGDGITYFLSQLMLHEYDCVHRTEKLLSVKLYEQKNKEKITFSHDYNDSTLRRIAPDTSAEKILKFVCSYK